jgi:acetyl esterase
MSLHPSAQAMLEMFQSANAQPTENLDLAAARTAAVQGVIAIGLEPPPGVSAKDEHFAVPGGEIALRIYRPEGSSGAALPVVLFFHGGGWVVCDLESHDHLCRHIAAGAKCAVVAVDYRLAPENRFPAAIEDAESAARWLLSNAERLELDISRVAVCGDSAGGNLSAVLALQSGKNGLPRIALQVLIYPVCDVSSKSESYWHNGTDYLLTERTMAFFIDQYVPDIAQRADWRASPLLAANLAEAAPALIYTAEYDVLHDEGAAYAAKLRKAGVKVRYCDIPGHMHGFLTAGKLLPIAAEIVKEICNELHAAFAI